jgi:hypothetical protein
MELLEARRTGEGDRSMGSESPGGEGDRLMGSAAARCGECDGHRGEGVRTAEGLCDSGAAEGDGLRDQEAGCARRGDREPDEVRLRAGDGERESGRAGDGERLMDGDIILERC